MTDDELLIKRALIAAGCAWKADGHQITPEMEVASEREVRQILRECASRIRTLLEQPTAAAQLLLRSEPSDKACKQCWGLMLLPRGLRSVVGYYPCPECGNELQAKWEQLCEQTESKSNAAPATTNETKEKS